jgi:PilZ domain
MDMSNPPRVEDPELARTRSKSRESMFLLAVVSLEGVAKPLSARVRNLSAGGMMVDSTLAYEKGHRLTAAIKNIGDVAGYVAWSTATRMGIAFDHEIDPKLARLPVGTSPPVPVYAQPVVGRRPGLTIR